MKDFRVLIFALTAFMGLEATAQDNFKADASLDVVSRYIWRGQPLSDAAVQPTGKLSYKGLSLSAFGSFGFVSKSDTREFDLTLSYKVGGFNVGVTDYYFSYYGMENKYFEYRAHQTSHVWEANVGYDFGPVAVQWFTNFAGNDGLNKSGKRAYSSFFEVSAPFRFVTCDWLAAVGAVPYATSYYSDAGGFAVTKVALRVTKSIPICKKWGIPVFVEGSANPSTKRAYFVAGFTLAP